MFSNKYLKQQGSLAINFNTLNSCADGLMTHLRASELAMAVIYTKFISEMDIFVAPVSLIVGRSGYKLVGLQC